MKIHTDYLIIGGGIAGTTAAEVIRERDAAGTIAIITKEKHPLYSRVLLPAYVEGRIRREQVFSRTVEDYGKKNINFFGNEEVTSLDVIRKEARTNTGSIFYFKELLIATGGHPRPWRVEGDKDVPVCRLHTIEDADVMRELLAKTTVPNAVVIGGGFIGLELINAFVPRGLSVDCIIREDRYWERCLDEGGSAFLEEHLARHRVLVHHEQEISAVRRAPDTGIAVFTTKRKEFSAGVVAAGVGITRAISVFSGLGMEADRGLKTNQFLESSVKDIWVAGDSAEYYDTIFENYMLMGDWSSAFLQGRVAGENMASRLLSNGKEMAYSKVAAYAIDVLGMHVTLLGNVYTSAEFDEAYTRMREEEFYERFLLRNGRLVGAVLINKFSDRKIIEHLIRSKADVRSQRTYFEDPEADLSGIETH